MSSHPPSSRAIDPTLARLLLEEIERREASLADGADEGEQRKAVHALKGSAGLAGETALAQALGRIERRIGAGEGSAIADARELISEATLALREGRAIPAPEWPLPPRDLRVRPIDPEVGARYAAEMVDRLERIDHALGGELGDDASAAAAAYREIHAMKGAALAVGDELTAWFCHGMEEKLRTGEQSDAAGRRGLAELARMRGVLGELGVAPEHALEMLRAEPRGRSEVAPGPLPLPPRRPQDHVEAEPRSIGDPTLRVPAVTLDRLFERVRQLDQTRAPIGDGAATAHAFASRARQLRHSLGEALRLIGPPRPWGAPAAAIRRIESAAAEVSALGDGLDREASRLKETADQVRTDAAAAHGALAEMRTTNVHSLFDRVSATMRAQARREGREVRIAIDGADTAIDRRIAELLVDPVLQLARNAVAHGIEPAAERALRGKPRIGTIRLRAEPRGGGLRLWIADDGAGVDVADVRGRAVATGTISAEVAHAADDQTLLALLFVPGFTTRDSADLLAGRGVGLDLTLEAVRRLGGTIRLASERGAGLTATIDVPLDRGLVKILWLDAGQRTYAIPVQHTRRIFLGRDDGARDAVSLDACLRRRSRARDAESPIARAAFAIEIAPGRDEATTTVLGVDSVGAIEEVALRAVSPVITTAGPYAGAVLRGGELRLCLDADALVELCTRFTARQAPRS